MPYRSPQFKAATLAENKYTVTFDHVGTGLFTLHWSKPRGFAVCGEDQKWFWAEAAILDTDKVLVWCDAVKKPVALRYGWADNPQCSLYSREGLPVTPFRTDDFKAKDDP
jgi:sialate O-acetylesterase